MKHIAIIGTILILLILTAGCLDDLSSTLPPCCDGTCNMTKTSVIMIEKTYFGVAFESRYNSYITDSDGIKYTWDSENATKTASYYDPYNNHNVTFSYKMVNGHRHITGIIEDHDARKQEGCCCYQCVDYPSGGGCECVQKCCGCEGK